MLLTVKKPPAVARARGVIKYYPRALNVMKARAQ
jgi:hypothetical protein